MSEFIFKIAETDGEIKQYFRLRHGVFVEEQKIFPESDVDEYDRDGVHIVAVQESTQNVVGVVRCYRENGNTWFGGRLGSAPGFRNGRVAPNLVRLAVKTVKSRGCKTFLAYIQPQNVKFFERLGWKTVGNLFIHHGMPHQLMEADLDSA